MFVNITGPVVANTVYANNKLVAKDVSLTLPEVTPATADVQAMGTMSMPIWQLIENMETTIADIRHDKGLAKLIKPEPLALEFRWVQTQTDAEGATKNIGCKAFIKGIPSKIPGASVTLGEASGNECTVTVTRYQLFVDGEEMFLIDRLAGIVRIDGKDYSSGKNNLL